MLIINKNLINPLHQTTQTKCMPNTTHQSSDKIIINQISVAIISQNTHQIFN